MSLATATTRSVAPAQASHAWRLPTADALKVYLSYASIVAALFVVGYGGANRLASQREGHLKAFLDA